MNAYPLPLPPATPRPSAGRADGSHDADVMRTLRSFEDAGIAVFPGRVGRKGSYTESWPGMSAEAAFACTRRAHAAGPINLAGRTGNGWAVLDLDGQGDVRPDELLPLLRQRLGDSVFAIVKTRRGFHLWVRVKEGVGNGYCAFIGGEVFSGEHLAMLPTSLHPEGGRYDWVVRPQRPREVADLRALGLTPSGATPGTKRTTSSQSRLAPAPADVQEAFASLMARAGVARRAGRV